MAGCSLHPSEYFGTATEPFVCDGTIVVNSLVVFLPRGGGIVLLWYRFFLFMLGVVALHACMRRSSEVYRFVVVSQTIT